MQQNGQMPIRNIRQIAGLSVIFGGNQLLRESIVLKKNSRDKYKYNHPTRINNFMEYKQ